MVLSQGNRYAYVTDYGVDTYTSTAEGGKTISIVDLEAGATHRHDRPRAASAGRTASCSASRGASYITVDHPAAVIEVDAEARRVAAEHLLDQKLPHMVAVSPDERFLYTANAGSGTVSIIDRRAGGETRRRRGRRGPDGARARAVTAAASSSRRATPTWLPSSTATDRA